MINRRQCLRTVGAFTMLGLVPGARAGRSQTVSVYKNPACGCCGEWVKHIEASGMRVEMHELNDLAPIRLRYGVPDKFASCHTAVVAGYSIEGHVPAGDIKRLLRERLKVRGLAVPGMIPGSPGMEQGPPQHYATLVFDENGSKVFAQH